MQLIYAAASPFARKVRVLAFETGLLARIELLDTAVLPTTLNERVNALNPLGKIPVLLSDAGEALYDSRVICEYLDTLHDGARLLPQDDTRWPVLRLAALADGLMDAALLARYEKAVRQAEQQSQAWLEGQLGKVQRALADRRGLRPGLSGFPFRRSRLARRASGAEPVPAGLCPTSLDAGQRAGLIEIRRCVEASRPQA
jgi:glutathione S-transferase